ncbi:telomere-associated protein Tap [Streptomyces xiamenensis]|uniref:telomere-associated protein Tap n=1 Tax=Streptomyces xiamenensis TaxID=408015 RepID=UPI0035D6124D
MTSKDQLMANVDALLAAPQLPHPHERRRLREAAQLTQEQLAGAFDVTRQAVAGWERTSEEGGQEPREPQREAYLHLLKRLAERHPPQPATAPAPRPPASSGITPPADSSPHQPAAPRKPTPRRQVTPTPTTSTEPRFSNGPLAVVDSEDGELVLHLTDGRTGTCPAATLPDLVEWTLANARLGAPKLSPSGRDSDPLLVLTHQATVQLGLPLTVERARLADDHPVIKEISKAKWKLTQRGLGPWARLYRPVSEDGRRNCVQFAILPWGALDQRSWGAADQLPVAALARLLGLYASLVLTPRGSTAVNGLELMTALRPETRAVRGPDGGWTSGPVDGSLTEAVDPAPPEAPREHPVAVGRRDEDVMDEEAFEWVRPLEALDEEEIQQPYAVGLDVNTAFLAAAARLRVGLCAPIYTDGPRFDSKLPGVWHVDLSHADTDPRLPNPFTPTGERPQGPGWYATPTVAYAVELGYTVKPLAAWIRPEAGPYLNPWHDRLRKAYLTTMAGLGVPDKLSEADYLRAMTAFEAFLGAAARYAPGEEIDTSSDLWDHNLRAAYRATAGRLHHADAGEETYQLVKNAHRTTDPHLAMVLTAVKGTVKGGVGQLRSRPKSIKGYRPGQRWPALDRPTWRPDIRAAVISTARVNMHRKMMRIAKHGLFPVAVLSDCAVYPSSGPSPLDLLPRDSNGKGPAGGFGLGVNPGKVKHEGTQPMWWAAEHLEAGRNVARHIKDGSTVDGGDE